MLSLILLGLRTDTGTPSCSHAVRAFATSQTVLGTASPLTCFRAAPHCMTWPSCWPTPWTRLKSIRAFCSTAREQARRIMETGEGLEITRTQWAQGTEQKATTH